MRWQALILCMGSLVACNRTDLGPIVRTCEVTAIASPANPTTATDARIELVPSPACQTLTLQCNLDDGGYAPCDTVFEVMDLAEGDHRFAARLIDPQGNTSEPLAFTWTIDHTAPAVVATELFQLVKQARSVSCLGWYRIQWCLLLQVQRLFFE